MYIDQTPRPDLDVLRVSLERSRRAPEGRVVLELFVSGDCVHSTKLEAVELGLPTARPDPSQSSDTTSRPTGVVELDRMYRYSEPPFSLPSDTTDLLGKVVRDRMRTDVLWLEVVAVTDVLAVVPWERLLAPILPGVRVLRLVAEPRTPWVVPDSLDVALLMSAPRAEKFIPLGETAEALARSILGACPGRTVLHVLADGSAVDDLRDRLGPVAPPGGENEIRIYDPRDRSSSASGESDVDVPALESPWLRWAARALASLTVDTAHFVCHGVLASEEGAICFAESPTRNENPDWAQIVEAGEIATFLASIAASSVVFSSPPNNYSTVGSRLLAAALPRLRPGPVVLHETHSMTDYDEAGRIYRLLYHPEREQESVPPETWVSCPPSLVVPRSEAAAPTSTYGAAKKAAPKWLTGSRRSLSQIASEAPSRQASSLKGAPALEGVDEALDFVEDLLERHAEVEANAETPEEGER